MEIWRSNQMVQRPVPLAAALPPEGGRPMMEENGGNNGNEDDGLLSKSNAPVPISFASTNGAIVAVDGHQHDRQCCNANGGGKVVADEGGRKKKTKSRKLEYMECLKNHAAALGGHILDGCGEFMASPDTNPSEPTSLTCAACGCHRNFHRQRCIGEAEVDDSNANDGPCMLMALSRAGCRPLMDSDPQPRRKKRFRTRFSSEQKEMMRQLSERLGWRMPKRDDVMLDESCRAIGVSRSVFKVWMHNNKNSSLNTARLNDVNGAGTDSGNINDSGNGVGIDTCTNNNHDRLGGACSSSSPSPSPSPSSSTPPSN